MRLMLTYLFFAAMGYMFIVGLLLNFVEEGSTIHQWVEHRLFPTALTVAVSVVLMIILSIGWNAWHLFWLVL